MARYFYIYDNLHHREFVVEADPRSQILFSEIDDIVGDKKTWYDIPVSIEVDGWGEDACIGDRWEDDDDDFFVEAITEEEYRNYYN